MTALPYFPSSQVVVNQCCTVCDTINYPGYSNANIMVMVPQKLDSVGQIGSIPILKAFGQIPGTATGQNLFGFVVPPMSQFLAHIQGKASFTTTATADALDSWSYLAGLAGPLIGKHAGTDNDPLELASISLFADDPGGVFTQPATSMRRTTTVNVPIFTAMMDLLNVRFTNTTNQPWFVSPGMAIKDYNTNPLTFLTSFNRTVVNTTWFKVLNYVANAIINNVVPALNNTLKVVGAPDPGFYVSH